VGSAAAFHARTVPEPAGRAVWSFAVDRPAVVLGSTQADDVVDRARATAAGIEVVRRRSGGGAVHLAPGDVLWVDVVLPRDDPLWDDDVSRSAVWLGRAWGAALAACGVAAEVHEGPMVRTRWSPLVCFAGLAPGEATVGGAKVLGVSQRRARHAARFQCALLARWDPAPLLDVLAMTAADRAEARSDLAGAAAGVPVPPAAVAAALAAALPA
jgi:lipoate---protein ligase